MALRNKKKASLKLGKLLNDKLLNIKERKEISYPDNRVEKIDGNWNFEIEISKHL